MSEGRTRGACLITVVVAVSALAGCSAQDGDSGNPPTTSPPPVVTPSAGVDTSSPSSNPNGFALVAEASGSSASCVELDGRSALVSMYDPIAQAQGDITITRAEAVGRHVRLVEAEGVLVTSRPHFGPGVLVDDTWPLRSSMLRKKTDPTTRQDLRGMHVADGQRVLPLVEVRGGPGSTLDGLELTYVDAGDDSRSVTLPIGTRFVGGTCSS